ncbi:MAG: DUF817 domain-containing protein [Bacillaceae bacterium]|nr:DUF817 domain-containing protein [Bacillaceae bacterium]
MSCIFPVAIFLALGISKFIEIPLIPRYDFILIVSILVQALMLWTGLETRDELKVITVFHLIGLMLEIYKVHMGSWAYPEEAWSKVFGVPLYSGFMYASVASYMIQAWRRLKLEIFMWPKAYYAVPLSAAIYLNFFTHHFIYDMRWILTALLFVVFFRTTVRYVVNGHIYHMPMILAYFLIAFFIWIAENISTILGGYIYPNQTSTWELVHLGKISSWFLLVVISMIIVAQLKRVKAGLQKKDPSANQTITG